MGLRKKSCRYAGFSETELPVEWILGNSIAAARRFSETQVAAKPRPEVGSTASTMMRAGTRPPTAAATLSATFSVATTRRR